MEKLGFAANSDDHDKANYKDAKDRVLSSLKDHFRTEFLNRVDDIIIFDILSPEAIREIVEIQVREVVKRLKDKDMDLVIDPAAFEYLSKEGYNPQYGARPLRRLIQTKILTPVANLLISQQAVKGSTITVTMVPSKADKNTKEFFFEVRKRKRGEGSLIMRQESLQK
jgi:ATP-dependent Clp protease ATP-binding subunit ClpA